MYVVQSQSVAESSLPRYPPIAPSYGKYSGAMSPKSGRELCSIHCPLGAGQVPSLQCSVCLCLYHKTCAGVQPNQSANFVCKSCQLPDVRTPPPPLTHVSAMKPSLKGTQSALPSPPVLQRAPKETPARIPQPLLVPVIKRYPLPKQLHTMKTVSKLVPVTKKVISKYNDFRPIQQKKKSIVSSVTTWLPPSSSIRLNKPAAKNAISPADMIMSYPQTIAIVNGKKYIVVPKHNVVNLSSQFPGNGGSLMPKQAENAPKIMTVENQQSNPATSKPIKTEECELGLSDKPQSENLDTIVDDKSKSDKSDMELGEAVKSELKVDVDEGNAEMTHKPAAESPTEKKKAKPVVTPKISSPKVVTPVKSPKVTKASANGTPAKRGRLSKTATKAKSGPQSQEAALTSLMQCGMFVQIFGYLNKRELSSAARVCRSWRDVAYTPSLWRTVRMKNSQVTDWQGLAATLKRLGTRHLDLRKMLLPPDDTQIWDQFIKHISSVDTLLRLEMCRCPASVVERACAALPQLQSLWACSVRCTALDPAPLARLTSLTELRLKGMSGLVLTSDLKCLQTLTNLKHLSLTSVKELEKHQCSALGALTQLEQLELGDCGLPGAEGAALLAPLRRLAKLRLERSPAEGSAQLVAAVAKLPRLASLELINFDIKTGFEEALGQCSNLRRLLIIPMYISQSATTNRCVLEGVLRLSKTLTHLVWGVTIELLRVTELFIDQCDRPSEQRPAKPAKKNMSDCIPVLKPVPGTAGAAAGAPAPPPAGAGGAGGPAQVEILPLPALQRLLATELPDTRLRILRIPFHATTRQALVDLD